MSDYPEEQDKEERRLAARQWAQKERAPLGPCCVIVPRDSKDKERTR